MLIGQSVEPAQRQAIRDFIERAPGGQARVQPDHPAAGQRHHGRGAGRDGRPARRRCETIVAQINAIEAALKAAFPEVRWSFFEPDDSP